MRTWMAQRTAGVWVLLVLVTAAAVLPAASARSRQLLKSAVDISIEELAKGIQDFFALDKSELPPVAAAAPDDAAGSVATMQGNSQQQSDPTDPSLTPDLANSGPDTGSKEEPLAPASQLPSVGGPHELNSDLHSLPGMNTMTLPLRGNPGDSLAPDAQPFHPLVDQTQQPLLNPDGHYDDHSRPSRQFGASSHGEDSQVFKQHEPKRVPNWRDSQAGKHGAVAAAVSLDPRPDDHLTDKQHPMAAGELPNPSTPLATGPCEAGSSSPCAPLDTEKPQFAPDNMPQHLLAGLNGMPISDQSFKLGGEPKLRPDNDDERGEHKAPAAAGVLPPGATWHEHHGPSDPIFQPSDRAKSPCQHDKKGPNGHEHPDEASKQASASAEALHSDNAGMLAKGDDKLPVSPTGSLPEQHLAGVAATTAAAAEVKAALQRAFRRRLQDAESISMEAPVFDDEDSSRVSQVVQRDEGGHKAGSNTAKDSPRPL